MATRIEPSNGTIIVKAATTGAGLTHSGPQTVDGVSCVAGDLVLDKDNGTGSLQAIWLVQASAWIMVDPGMSDGLMIEVLQGTTNGDHTFRVTNSVVWGTDTPTVVDQTGGSTGGMVTLSGAQTFTGAKTFADTKLLLRNAADTFSTTVKAAAATAARVISLPDATDTLAALGVAQAWTAIQTFNAGFLKFNNAGNTFATLMATLATAARTATFPDSDLTVAGINVAQLWSAIQTIGHQLLKINNAGATFATRIGSLVTANRDVNFPDAAGTVVLDTAAQTLTSKTIASFLTAAAATVTADQIAGSNGVGANIGPTWSDSGVVVIFQNGQQSAVVGFDSSGISTNGGAHGAYGGGFSMTGTGPYQLVFTPSATAQINYVMVSK